MLRSTTVAAVSSGYAAFCKAKFPERKAAIQQENPDLTPKKVFAKTKVAVDIIEQGYMRPDAPKALKVPSFAKFAKHHGATVYMALQVDAEMAIEERFAMAKAKLGVMWRKLTPEQRIEQGYWVLDSKENMDK
jgi:hypothetical protein